LFVYLRSTKAITGAGKYAMVIFVLFLLLANVINIFGPFSEHSKFELMVQALVLYFLFAGIAHWLDKKRA